MGTTESKKKVVVTGGAGFVGSHLAAGLIKRDYGVTIIDDLSTGKEENIRRLLDENGAEFVRGSITDNNLLMRLFQGADYVFHLAAIASVPLSVRDPFRCHEINVAGTLNVLTAARDSGVGRVIFASSCAVYGDAPDIPLTEDNPPDPQSPYAMTKLNGESSCREFQQVYSLSTVSLRFFNIYGPGQEPGSPYSAVVPEFLKRVSEGNPPVIHGDGTQKRDFIYIDDAVSAFILAAEKDTSGVYNIGSGVGTTIDRLAGMVISLFGKDVTRVYAEPREGDVRYSTADISRVKALGFKPECSLETGLKRMIEKKSCQR